MKASVYVKILIFEKMKTIQLLLLGLVLLTTKAYGQNSCKYSSSSGFSGESLELLDSNNFKYQNSSCTHSIVGYGKYKKTKRKIELYFAKDPELKSSCVSNTDSFTNFNSDTINLLFLVKDINQKSIEFATISILDSSNKKIKSTFTDSNGIGKLSVKKSNNIRFVEISMLGFKKQIAPINDNHFNYTFTINLNWRQDSVPEDWKVFTYKIGKQMGDKINLKRNESKYLKYTVNCKS